MHEFYEWLTEIAPENPTGEAQRLEFTLSRHGAECRFDPE